MKKGLIIGAVILFVLGVIGSGVDDKEQQPKPKAAGLVMDKVLDVSDFDFTLRNKPAVSVYFGGDETNYFSVTIHKSNVREGFSAQLNRQPGSDQIDALMSLKGKSYFQTGKHDTWLKFSIDQLDTAKKQAVVTVSGVFVAPLSDEYITVDKSTAVISGQNFDNFVMK